MVNDAVKYISYLLNICLGRYNGVWEICVFAYLCVSGWEEEQEQEEGGLIYVVQHRLLIYLFYGVRSGVVGVFSMMNNMLTVLLYIHI